VPALTTEARRAYEQKTSVHQQVMGEIDALKRALTRNQRELAALDQRIGAASGDIAAGLSQERTRVAVQIQTQQAELEAANAEYQDLPHTPLEFMPVTIEVGVTESRSEKAALLALAGVIDSNGGQLASAGATASAGLFSRSLDLADNSARAGPAAELASTRARYFDALVAVKTGTVAASSDDAKRNLADARMKYNDARRALGLELIE
jgi:chromosome segregation ATPase